MKEVNYKNGRIRKAFTLIEVMLLLVVLSLIFASSASIITRKHKLKPRRSVHGTYICYRNRDDGNLHEIMYSGKSLLRENNQTTNPAFTECSFSAPTTASYIYIQLVGGGGAGGNPNHRVATNSGYSWLTGSTVIDLLNANTTTGLTTDYVHGFKWNDKTFSAKWLRKFLHDNQVKMAYYDYAGNGARGGGIKHNYHSRSTKHELTETEAADSSFYYWQESYCRDGYSSNQVRSPIECLKYFRRRNTTFVGKVNPNKSFYYFKNTGTGAPDPGAFYCQQRKPVYKNCPWLRAKYAPINSTFVCSGGRGGQGGIIVTPVVDYDFGYSYERGKRIGYKLDGSVDPNKVIDWSSSFPYGTPDIEKGIGLECLVAGNYDIDYSISKPGELLTVAEACVDGDVTKGCTDIEGNPIENPRDEGGYVASNTTYKNELVYKYIPHGTDSYGNPNNYYYDYVMETGYEPLKDYYGSSVYSKYFKTYPVANYKYQDTMECVQADEVTLGATKGKDGGLPYFENELGMKVGEGIKMCKDGACTLYSSSNIAVTGDSFVAGKGGKPSFPVEDMVDDQFLKLRGENACPNPDNEDSGIAGESGSIKMDLTGFGTYAMCSGPTAIIYTPNPAYTTSTYMFRGSGSGYAFSTSTIKSDSANLTFPYNYSSSSSYYYKCPRTTSGGGTIGLSIAHYNGSMRMYYGEKGYAGNYRSLFARSFGDSSLKMEPGRGGEALTVNPGSALPGNNGEDTTLSTGCDADGNNCDVVVSVKGGLGGRSHLYDQSYEYRTLTNQEIYEFVTNPQTAPEPKYSLNYEDGTYIGDDSEFQQVSFLSDLSMIENGEVVALIGKGGNAGWVKHNCWIRPQYFVYKYRGRGYTTSASSYAVEIPNIDGDEYVPEGETYDEWEGYTNMNSALIRSIEACSKDGKQPEYQFEETQATNGYPGAIVIMW